MDTIRDDEFKAQLLSRMAAREFAERKETHCSDLIYCLNKVACRRICPAPVKESDLLHFTLGWACQRWLCDQAEVPIEVDGIWVTPDAIEDGVPWELKASSTSSTKPITENVAWMRQVMAQCKVTNTLTARLSRLELMGDWSWVYHRKDASGNPEHPTLSVWRLSFTPTDIDVNWLWLKKRKVLFENILATKTLLAPSLALPPRQEWECKYCDYQTQCQTGKI